MTAKEICKRVWELSEPFAQEIGVSLWDVIFEKEGGQYMLTIIIDRNGNTSIDDCERLSRAVDPLLDQKEFVSLPPYTLCVSSAGLTRRLKRPEHFAAFIGSEVDVKFYRPINGSKTVTGILEAYNDGFVTVDSVTYQPKDIAAVHLSVTI